MSFIHSKLLILLLLLPIIYCKWYSLGVKCKTNKNCKQIDLSSFCFSTSCGCKDKPYKDHKKLKCPSVTGTQCQNDSHLTKNAVCQNDTVVCKKGSIPYKFLHRCYDGTVPINKPCIFDKQCHNNDPNSKCLTSTWKCGCENGNIQVNGTEICKLANFSTNCNVSEVCGNFGVCKNGQCTCRDQREFNFDFSNQGGCENPKVYSRKACYTGTENCDFFYSFCEHRHCRCWEGYRFFGYDYDGKFTCTAGEYLNQTCHLEKDCKEEDSICSHQGCYCRGYRKAKLFDTGYQCVEEVSDIGKYCNKYDKIKLEHAKCIDGIVKCAHGYEEKDFLCFKKTNKPKFSDTELALITLGALMGGFVLLSGLVSFAVKGIVKMRRKRKGIQMINSS